MLDLDLEDKDLQSSEENDEEGDSEYESTSSSEELTSADELIGPDAGEPHDNKEDNEN